jgi:Zn-dependent metalloprotease
MRRIVTAGAGAVAIGVAVALTGIAGTSEARDGTPGTETFALAHARSALTAHAADLAATGADRFVERGVTVDANGDTHVRYDRTYHDLPVLGGDLVVHLDGAGGYRAATAALAQPLSLSTIPRVDANRAAQVAARAFAGTAAPAAPTLAIDTARTPRLVWRTSVPGVADSEGVRDTMNVLVDALTGQIEDAWSNEQTGTGTGFDVGKVTLDTTKVGARFQLKDPKRGGNFTTDMHNSVGSGTGALFTDADDKWGNGQLSNRQTVGVDAQYGVAKTWDYYKTVHGRNGIANNGKGSFSRVHYGTRYNNAFWSDSCFCMTYGDGDGVTFGPFAGLDVAGHEMSHGVTARTAGLRYSGESGGLNEATSDIFGTMVEFFAKNPADNPDYLIGEKIRKNGVPLRFMDDPKKDGRSASCWTPTVGNLDVHLSSGVANHFFFLLAVGSGAHTVNGVAYNSPTCGGAPAVKGIGNSASEKIWYRALTVYMTTTTNFKGARAATLKAAADLFGGTGSTQYKAVAAAWTAVNVK